MGALQVFILQRSLSFLLFFRFTQLCADIPAAVEDADYGNLMQTGVRSLSSG